MAAARSSALAAVSAVSVLVVGPAALARQAVAQQPDSDLAAQQPLVASAWAQRVTAQAFARAQRALAQAHSVRLSWPVVVFRAFVALSRVPVVVSVPASCSVAACSTAALCSVVESCALVAPSPPGGR